MQNIVCNVMEHRRKVLHSKVLQIKYRLEVLPLHVNHTVDVIIIIS